MNIHWHAVRPTCMNSLLSCSLPLLSAEGLNSCNVAGWQLGVAHHSAAALHDPCMRCGSNATASSRDTYSEHASTAAFLCSLAAAPTAAPGGGTRLGAGHRVKRLLQLFVVLQKVHLVPVVEVHLWQGLQTRAAAAQLVRREPRKESRSRLRSTAPPHPLAGSDSAGGREQPGGGPRTAPWTC